ncbi:MAG: succinate dehydrogenase/fumarate reductase transmembrane subunit [Planctomycetota bacterium]|jgi:fumarate reductase subunit C
MSRYRTPLPWYWFTRKRGYWKFMLREATSVFIAGYLVWLLVWLARLGSGPEAYPAMMESATSPAGTLLHLLAIAAAVYHSVTWFNLTPRIMPMYVKEDRVPDVWAAVAMGYLPWGLVTLVMLWGLLS